MRRGARLLALALCLLAALLPAARGALLAVDYGSEWVKAALVAPGRAPVSIVLNEASKRKSLAAVAFSGGERTLGDDAAALAARYPERVVLRARDLLGRPANGSALAAALAARYSPHAPAGAPGRGTVTLPAHGGAAGATTLTAEQLAASVLHYARRCAEAQAGATIRDAVVTVPPFWSQAQRAALADAAALAGLNLLSLVSEPSAAALQYGIDREVSAENATDLVVLYDMGAGKASAALVAYSSWKAKEGGKPKTFGQYEIKALAWDETAGGEALDAVLAEHFAAEANAKIGGGVDVRKSPKSMAKLMRQCKRTKEILSANAEAPISVEAIHGDFDFRSSITREKFEKLGASVFERAAAPLAEVLKTAGVAPSALSAVEILGGATRIPKVQAALVAALGGRALDKHLDADETVALGAGLLAANMSTTFRMRKYGSADAAPFAIALHRDGGGAQGGMEDEAEGGPDDVAAAAASPAKGDKDKGGAKLLVPRFKRLPARRVVTYGDVAADFRVTARYAGAPLPPAAADTGDLVGVWAVGGVAAARGAHNATGKVTLSFVMGRDGVLALERADAQVEVLEWYEEDAPASNATSANATVVLPNATAAESGNATGNGTAAPPPPPPPPPKIRKSRVRMGRVPLEAKLVAAAVPPLSAAERSAAAATLSAVAAADAARSATAEAKSGLEAYILRTRDALAAADAAEGDAGAALAAMTTPAQRSAFGADLEAAEEWLYGDGADGDAAAFGARSAALRATGDAMELRASERKARPAAAASARRFIADARAAAAAWPETKPHINATEIAALETQLAALEAWLAASEAKQAKTAAHDAPAFLAADVAAQTKPVEAAFAKLRKKPVPKPPKAAPNATDANATAANATAPPPADAPAAKTYDYDDGGAAEVPADDAKTAHSELR